MARRRVLGLHRAGGRPGLSNTSVTSIDMYAFAFSLDSPFDTENSVVAVSLTSERRCLDPR
jgi:hypothetical protein